MTIFCLTRWAQLAAKSIRRYERIARAADTPFYVECGILIFGRRDSFVRGTERVAEAMGTELERLRGADAIEARFPLVKVLPCHAPARRCPRPLTSLRANQ